MSDTTLLKMDKLSIQNYTTWSIVMQSALKSKKLWEFCVAKTESKQGESDEEAEKKMVKNEEAKTLIYLTMEPKQIIASGNCETAYDLWKKIKENYEGAEADMSNKALTEFLSIQYDKGEDFCNYCGRFELLLGKLETSGYQVPEAMKLFVFGKNLPVDLRKTFHTWSITTQNKRLSDIVTALKLQVQMENLEINENTALYSSSRRDTGNSANFHQRKTDFKNKKDQKEDIKTNQEKTKTASQDENFCTYCKLKNHSWKQCRKLKADQKRKKRFAEKKKREPEIASPAYMARDSWTPLKTPSNLWVIDSGASSHMSAQQDVLSDYSEFTSPKKITLGDGKTTNAYGQGNLHFRSGKYFGTLKSVLRVPAISENLISVGAAVNQGNEVEFKSRPKEVVFKREGQIVLKGKNIENGLFVVQLSAINSGPIKPYNH